MQEIQAARDSVLIRALAGGVCGTDREIVDGIKERDGFCVERFISEPGFLVRVDRSARDTGVLLEPASVVAKAWDHIERIGQYHCDSLDGACALGADVIIECTGAAAVMAGVIANNPAGAIVCLAGLSSGSHRIPYDFTGSIARGCCRTM